MNAAGQCDLVELCLDHLLKEPDVGDMLQGIPKPILVACRRPQDGGRFDGTEEERMTLLRQAIVAGPEYVELDLDTAPKVPRFGKTKRLISALSLQGPPEDLDAVYNQAVEAKADAIKFAWPAPTFEAVWPLLKIISQRREIPIVGLAVGRGAYTLALLGRARRPLVLRGIGARARIGSRPTDRLGFEGDILLGRDQFQNAICRPGRTHRSSNDVDRARLERGVSQDR